MSYEYQWADPLLYGLLKGYAKENRRNPTEAENVFWGHLRAGELGQPFKRQHIIGEFIADFVCLPAKLIIEVDGKYHQLPEQQASDEERQEWLEAKGFTVLRFTNEEVICNTDNVIETIEQYLE